MPEMQHTPSEGGGDASTASVGSSIMHVTKEAR